MEVYADILVLLNFAVDYFLLSLTAYLLKTGSGVGRQLVGAAVGGISSLIIFLPQLGAVFELLLKAAAACATVFAAFGFRSTRFFLRAAAIFFAATLGFAGGMLAVWQLLRPGGLIIRNSVVYIDISPLFLIGFSVVGYFAAVIFRKLFGENGSMAERCEICVYMDGSALSLTAIADTGNSLEDVFGSSEIIIAEPAAAGELLEKKTPDELAKRYRALPCSTVGGEGLLEGYRCDRAQISCRGKTTELKKPILAISKTGLGGDYSAVISPKIIE